MVKRNLFRYSSVLMCVVLTAASLVGCGSKTAATTGTDTAYVTEMAAGSTEFMYSMMLQVTRITSLSTKRLQTLTAMRLLIRLSQVKMRQ